MARDRKLRHVPLWLGLIIIVIALFGRIVARRMRMGR
jgi:hypothetical protein